MRINTIKYYLSPGCAVSTASARSTMSTERGMQPRGSSACTSWILTFWKSTNLDLLRSSSNRVLLLHTGFLQMAGCVYLNCCSTPWKDYQD